MDADKIIERLLETNERMVSASERNFKILATLFFFTVISFFVYISFFRQDSNINLSTDSTYESKIEQKVNE